jgi:glycerol kinase
MNGNEVIIALDVGTTGNRAVAFRRDGAVAAQAYRKLTQHYPNPGWVEHDPEELYATSRDVLVEVGTSVGAASVCAIGITNQRETSIVWERSTGKPVYNGIVWQDRRTTEQCEALARARRMVKKKTGLFLDPYFSATKIAWILDKVDPRRARASRGELLFGTPETWVLYNLTGGKLHATEPSNASRTILFNIHTLQWDADLLKLFRIPRQMLPEVRDSDALFGETAPALLGRAIPVNAMIGDQQSSLFGQIGWDSRTVKATYGTGIFILMNTGNSPVLSDKLISTVAWKTRDRGVRYALEGSLFMGGASVQWLQDNLGIISDPAETVEAARRASANEGVYFVPAFQGLGAPYWAPDARALIIGLSRKANRDTIVRAALESMAYQVRDVLEAFAELVSKRTAKMSGQGKKGGKGSVWKLPMKELRVDGGASKNDFLMQFQADLLAMPVVRPATTEATAFGAAGLAGIRTGFWTRESSASLSRIERTFTPSGERKTFMRYYEAWKQAVNRCLGWAGI